MNIRSILSLGLFALIFSFAITGCSSSTGSSGSSECSTNSECDPGEVCDGGECFQICSSDSNCDNSFICEGSICVEGARENAPEISTIDGNGSSVDHFENGIIITGLNMSGAAVELAGAQTHPLTIQDSGATQITALFPAELAEGNYTLKVFNSVGAAQSDVRILQGEPGDPKTAAEVLTLIKEVDGTGSGLDADLLDGLNSTDFVRSNGGNIAGDVSVDGALSLSGNLDADSASFSGSVKGVPRGRNLINWTDHIDKWEIVEGNPVVSLSTDSVEGATSFEFKDDTATSGTTALYGDYIAVDPGRHYVGRLQAKLLTGPGTGTFSAGYAAYDENQDPIPSTVDGDNYHFFMASDIVLVSGAAWQTFRSSDRFVVATAVLPADARFIRPLIKANTFAGSGTGTTLVDSMEIYETDGRTHSLGGKFIKLYEYDSANNPVVISPHLNICATSNSHIGCVDFQMVGAPHNTGAYTYSTGPKAIIWMTGNLVMDFKTTDAGVYLAISYTGAPAELNYSIRIASSHEIWPVAVSNIPTASTIYNVGKLN